MKKYATIFALSALAILFSAFRGYNNHPSDNNVLTDNPKPQVFAVDNTNSKLTWVAKKVTGEHQGTIKVDKGTFQVENNVLKSGSFTLDTKAIAVTDIADAESNAKLTNHLKGDDFFSVEKFPTATFVLASAKRAGGDAYTISGKLTIKGITNDVTFPAKVKIEGKKLTADAKISVDRTRYDIKYRSTNYFENLGDKAIYDNFDLDVKLVANTQ